MINLNPEPSHLVLSVLSLCCIAIPATTAAEPADVLFINGNIHTVNDRQPHAEAIAVREGKIIFVGSNAEGSKLAASKVIDLHGNTVVPGLTDSHCHLSGVGEREMTLNLEGTSSLEDFLAKVKARVDLARPGEWVTGRGWVETYWKPQVFPTRWDLDKVSPSNPVYLTRADGHGAVANSVAIKLAQVKKETPDPFGGEIMRDRQTREPNGMFLDNAQRLILKLIPPETEQQDERALMLGVQRSLALGWTELQVPSSSYHEMGLIRKLYEQNQIKLRIYLAVIGPGRPRRQQNVSLNWRYPVRAQKFRSSSREGAFRTC